MTQEDEQLLLVDLCARLPYYEIKVQYNNEIYNIDYISALYREVKLDIRDNYTIEIFEIKPYLRPISSMTEEEINEFILISDTVLWLGNKRSTCILSLEQMNWLNAHHFDYRGLIKKGLALESPEGMYK